MSWYKTRTIWNVMDAVEGAIMKNCEIFANYLDTAGYTTASGRS